MKEVFLKPIAKNFNKKRLYIFKILTRIVFLSLIIITLYISISIATTEEILTSQYETLNIKGFVKQADKYTDEVFKEIKMEELLNDSIKGKINNKTIFNEIINLFGKEIKETIKVIGSVIVIIVIHSVLKSVRVSTEIVLR